MIKVAREELTKRYDALPRDLREGFLSDANMNMLWTIGEAHHLNEERIEKVAGVLGYILLGLVHIEDLAKEIVAEINVDRRLADELTNEIRLKIVNPFIPQLQQLYHYGAAATGGPTTPPQASPAPPEILRPTFAPPGAEIANKEQEASAPFILHEEPDLRQGFGGQGEMRPRKGDLMRPSFYDPLTGSTGRGEESREAWIEPTTARLEIGGVEERTITKPPVGRTEEPTMRVVHYSGPQTPVDPFAPQTDSAGSPQASNQQPATSSEPPPPPPEVHPENIVDLKDLPK